MQSEIRLPQGTIRYGDTGGDGPVAVFVHGFMMGGDIWDRVTARLSAQGIRCITPTWPLGAHKVAMNPDADLSFPGVAEIVARFLEALDLDDVILVGNDSGGAVCQVLVTQRPERVGRLVLTPCDCFENCPPGIFKLFTPTARVPAAVTASIMPLRLRAPRYLPIAFGWVTNLRPLPHDLIDGWLEGFLSDKGVRRDTVKFMRGFGPEVTLEAASRLASFDRPALIAFARDDKLFPLEHGERLAKILPQGRFVALENTRTLAMLDQPEQLAEVIQAFVGETTQSEGRRPAGVSPGTAGK
jgi:pimeloyl-ACP methyl ester carboxylesterase